MTDTPAEAEAIKINAEAPAPQGHPDLPGRLQRLVAAVFGYHKSLAYNKRVADIDYEAAAASWNSELKNEELRAMRADAIGRAYSGAFDRGVRLEAKAVGYLQVLALAFAIVTLGIVRDSVAVRLTLVAGLVFLTLAVLGTIAVLQPGPRRQALVSDVTSPTNGMAEAAIAAADMDRRHIRSANFLAGARHDLLVGGAFTIFALVLIAAGLGDESETPTASGVPVRDDFRRAVSAATAAHEDATAIGYSVKRNGFEVELVLPDGRIFEVTLDGEFGVVRQREDTDDRVDSEAAARLGMTDLAAAYYAGVDEIGNTGAVTSVEVDRGGYEAEARRYNGEELDIDLDDQATVTNVQAND